MDLWKKEAHEFIRPDLLTRPRTGEKRHLSYYLWLCCCCCCCWRWRARRSGPQNRERPASVMTSCLREVQSTSSDRSLRTKMWIRACVIDRAVEQLLFHNVGGPYQGTLDQWKSPLDGDTLSTHGKSRANHRPNGLHLSYSGLDCSFISCLIVISVAAVLAWFQGGSRMRRDGADIASLIRFVPVVCRSSRLQTLSKKIKR